MATSPTPGTVIKNRYRLERQLGVGGMGEVWQARDSDIQDVALKFVRPDLRDDGTVVSRFEQEIRTAVTLGSTHAVRTLTFDRDESIGPYLVMELLEGETMRERLARGQFLDHQQAVDFLMQACDALAEAHAKEVIHRDLKPENLFLAKTKNRATLQLKVLDFGIARVAQELRTRKLTEPNVFVGSCNYSAPEQFGQGPVTARSDIWALGAILFEMLSGNQAYPGETIPAVVAQIFNQPGPKLETLCPNLPPGLVACVNACLTVDQDGRPSSVKELMRKLAPFGGQESMRIAAIHLDDFALERARTVHAYISDYMGVNPGNELVAEDFPERDALVEAILDAKLADGSPRSIVFMLGAGCSMPQVPGTEKILDKINESVTPDERREIKLKLETAGNRYQEAFAFLTNKKDTFAANRIVRKAVLKAYRNPPPLARSEDEQKQQCRETEAQFGRWDLPSGLNHLGAIIAAGLASRTDTTLVPGPGQLRFSSVHLTTNFDPLLEMAILKHGGTPISLAITDDSPLPPLRTRQACLVTHLHGKWDDGDTLHVNLATARPKLANSLRRLLARSTLVVVGYGGWNDVFMQALLEAASGESTADFEVLWCFYDTVPETIETQYGKLIRKLRQALPNRIRFYKDVNSNRFFEDLRLALDLPEPQTSTSSTESSSSRPPPSPLPSAPPSAVPSFLLDRITPGVPISAVPSTIPPTGGVAPVSLSPVPPSLGAPAPVSSGEIPVSLTPPSASAANPVSVPAAAISSTVSPLSTTNRVSTPSGVSGPVSPSGSKRAWSWMWPAAAALVVFAIWSFGFAPRMPETPISAKKEPEQKWLAVECGVDPLAHGKVYVQGRVWDAAAVFCKENRVRDDTGPNQQLAVDDPLYELVRLQRAGGDVLVLRRRPLVDVNLRLTEQCRFVNTLSVRLGNEVLGATRSKAAPTAGKCPFVVHAPAGVTIADLKFEFEPADCSTRVTTAPGEEPSLAMSCPKSACKENAESEKQRCTTVPCRAKWSARVQQCASND